MGNLLNLAIVFIVFICIALLWHQLFRVFSEESMALSAIFCIIIVFLCGLIGNVRYSYYILFLLSAVAIAVFAMDFSFVRTSENTQNPRLLQFFNPSVAIFSGIFLYTIVAFRGAMFIYPDEMFQWGPAVKYMVETGCLPYGEQFSGQEITLSTATMFQYLWTGLVSFRERNCLTGNFLFAFLPVFLPFNGSGWKEWKKIGEYSAVVFLMLNIFSYIKYYNLLQDFVLPMWAGGVIAWLFWGKSKEINWILLWGSLICIGSMKSLVGPLFAAIIILVILIRQMLFYQPSKWRDVINLKVGFYAMAIGVSTVSFSAIWSFLIKKNVYNRVIPNSSKSRDMLSIVINVVNRAFDIISGNSIAPPHMSFFMLFLFVLVLLCFLQKKFFDKREQTQFTIVFSLYGIGFILYLFVMIYAYLNVFGVDDSEIVAGLERYLSYYMLLGAIPIASLFFMEDRVQVSGQHDLIVHLLLIGLIFGTGGDFLTKISTINQSENSIYKDCLKAEEQNEKIISLAGEEGKLMILGTLSFDKSKLLAYKFGEKYTWDQNCYKMYHRQADDEEKYCDIIRYPQLLKLLQFEYLWCYQMDGEARELRYLYDMKEMEDGALYRIKRNADEIEMEYLGNTMESPEE